MDPTRAPGGQLSAVDSPGTLLPRVGPAWRAGASPLGEPRRSVLAGVVESPARLGGSPDPRDQRESPVHKSSQPSVPRVLTGGLDGRGAGHLGARRGLGLVHRWDTRPARNRPGI